MDRRPIGVFDSGLGGLTAVRELTEALPREDIIYFGDTGRVPYGGRSKETIIKYARQDIAFLRRYDIKAVVVACGTVSTNALYDIADDYDIPVIGVVEAAARAAAAATKNGRVGLIGTLASIRSAVYDDRIQRYLPSAEIVKGACPLFVPVVENGRSPVNDEILDLLAEEYLAPMRDAGVDTLIMGCTHYPIIRDVIAAHLGRGVTLIDPGAETARALGEYLRGEGLLTDSAGEGRRRYFVSDSAEGFSSMASIFMGGDVSRDVTQISVDDIPTT